MSAEKNQIPEGFTLVAVKGFSDLVYWLNRCDYEGHLENCSDLIEPWAAFDFRIIDAPDLLAERDRLKAANAELAAALKDAALIADFAECWITDPAIEGVQRLKGSGDKFRAALAKHTEGQQ